MRSDEEIAMHTGLQRWAKQASLSCLMCLVCQSSTHAAQLPAGLPELTIPSDTPLLRARVALGRKIFFDKRMSGDCQVSCASCHQPERAFADGLRVAKGMSGRSGTRNTPSLLNVAFNQSLFWDGRRADLESQALDPLFNPREHGLKDAQSLLEILRRDSGYVMAFQDAFHVAMVDVRVEQVALALASFERTLVAGDSAFDRYFYRNEKTAMTGGAIRGLAIFRGVARCSTCHIIEKSHALFTDNQFHTLGVGLRSISPRLARITSKLINGKLVNDHFDQVILRDEDVAELGRFVVTYQPADIGKFRTPSLRNVALTAPYMHDGSVPTLEDAVEYELYYRSVESGRPLILTPGERSDLVEFLKALSSN